MSITLSTIAPYPLPQSFTELVEQETAAARETAGAEPQRADFAAGAVGDVEFAKAHDDWSEAVETALSAGEAFKFLCSAVARLHPYGFSIDQRDPLEPHEAASLADFVGKLWLRPDAEIDLSPFAVRTLGVGRANSPKPFPFVASTVPEGAAVVVPGVPGGVGVDQTARDAAQAAQDAADDAEILARAGIERANEVGTVAEANAAKLMPPSGAEADAAKATTIRGWTAALIARVVRGVIPGDDRILRLAEGHGLSPIPTEIPRPGAGGLVTLRGRLQNIPADPVRGTPASTTAVYGWDDINLVPDTPGTAGSIGDFLRVFGEGDKDYRWQEVNFNTIIAEYLTANPPPSGVDQIARDGVAANAADIVNAARNARIALSTSESLVDEVENAALDLILLPGTIPPGEGAKRTYNGTVHHVPNAYIDDVTTWKKATVLEIWVEGNRVLSTNFNPLTRYTQVQFEISGTAFDNLITNGRFTQGSTIAVEVRIKAARQGSNNLVTRAAFFKPVWVFPIAAGKERFESDVAPASNLAVLPVGTYELVFEGRTSRNTEIRGATDAGFANILLSSIPTMQVGGGAVAVGNPGTHGKRIQCKDGDAEFSAYLFYWPQTRQVWIERVTGRFSVKAIGEV